VKVFGRGCRAADALRTTWSAARLQTSQPTGVAL